MMEGDGGGRDWISLRRAKTPKSEDGTRLGSGDMPDRAAVNPVLMAVSDDSNDNNDNHDSHDIACAPEAGIPSRPQLLVTLPMHQGPKSPGRDHDFWQWILGLRQRLRDPQQPALPSLSMGTWETAAPVSLRSVGGLLEAPPSSLSATDASNSLDPGSSVPSWLVVVTGLPIDMSNSTTVSG